MAAETRAPRPTRNFKEDPASRSADISPPFRALTADVPTPPMSPRASSTETLLDRTQGLVLAEAVNAAEISALAAAAHRWVAELQDWTGCTGRVAEVRARGLLDALTLTVEQLSRLAGQLTDSLAALSERDEVGDPADPAAVAPPQITKGGA